jgi:FMN-dependent NADH-azoreductase
VGLIPPAHLNEIEHTAMFVPPEMGSPDMVAAQERAAALADELFAADAILIAAPLYNLGISAGLKSWLDHVHTDLRLFPGFGLTQPLAGRRCVVVTARGGTSGPGSPMHGWDYENPFLRRQLVDILGLDLTEVVIDLTLAHLDPRKSHLVPVAEQSHREGTSRRSGSVASSCSSRPAESSVRGPTPLVDRRRSATVVVENVRRRWGHDSCNMGRLPILSAWDAFHPHDVTEEDIQRELRKTR